MASVSIESTPDLGSNWGSSPVIGMPASDDNIPSNAAVIAAPVGVASADAPLHPTEVAVPAIERETDHPYNVLPERPLSAFFNVAQVTGSMIDSIFQDIKSIGLDLSFVKCM